MLKLAKELAPDVVARIKDQCSLNEDSAMECPVCMDMADNPTIFIPCGHNTCSECFARISDPSQANADGTEGRNPDVKCPNCRGKVIPTKVIDHNAFKRVYLPDLMTDGLLDDDDDSQADVETTDDSDSDDDEDEEDEGVDSKGNLLGFVVQDDEEEDSSETEEGHDSYDPGEASGKKPSKSKKAKQRNKGKGKAKEKKPPRQTLAELKKAGMRNIKARQRYLKRLNKEWIPSGKTEKTMEVSSIRQSRGRLAILICDRSSELFRRTRIRRRNNARRPSSSRNSPLYWTYWKCPLPMRDGVIVVMMAVCLPMLGTRQSSTSQTERSARLCWYHSRREMQD